MAAENKVRVWDLPTRVFHWALAALVALAYLTGEVLGERWLGAHVAVGTAVAGLLGFRLVWGVFGPEPSRFASFAYGWREALSHLRDVARLSPRRYLGHNPAGALMIFALLAALAGILLSGVVALGGEEKRGPLAGVVPYRLGHAFEELHEGLVGVLFVLVGLHVAGVLIESLLTRENLVRAMIDGDKRIEGRAPALRRAQPFRAALALAALAGGILYAYRTLAAVEPPQAVPVGANPSYVKECGACHDAFHPSLLAAGAWRRTMDGLADHFGEDAALPAGTTAALADWLAAHAAEAHDTKAAHMFGAASALDPPRIAATRAWARAHREVPEGRFAAPPVGGKLNCSACHRDAASGRFGKQAVVVPDPPRKEKS